MNPCSSATERFATGPIERDLAPGSAYLSPLCQTPFSAVPHKRLYFGTGSPLDFAIKQKTFFFPAINLL